MYKCFPVYVHMHHVRAWHPERTEEGIRSLGTWDLEFWILGATIWCLEPKPSPLKEQQVLFIAKHLPYSRACTLNMLPKF